MVAAEDWWGQVSQESETELHKADQVEQAEPEQRLAAAANVVEAVVVLVKDWDLDWELKSE